MVGGYYSFAGSRKGHDDPEQINVFHVDANGKGCDLRGCIKSDCDHVVIEWGGKEYSKSNTWIAAEEDDYLSLGEME
jgi:hypothetical protein